MRLQIIPGVALSFSLIAGLISPCPAPAKDNQQAKAVDEQAHIAHQQVRVLDIGSISNFRDIGGYLNQEGLTTKWQKIFRSGDLSRFSARDQSKVSALGIHTVIDLRSDEERLRAPSRRHDEAQQPTTILLPIGGSAADWSSKLSRQLQSGDFTREEIRATIIDMYGAVPLSNKTEYKSLFTNILASNGQPVLFHCTSGKDRTGIGAALILSALHVPRKTIIKDFLLTNEAINVELMSKTLAKVFSRQSGHAIDPDAIVPLLTVEQVYLETTFTVIDKAYGSMDNYLRDALDLTSAKRTRLKQALLDTPMHEH